MSLQNAQVELAELIVANQQQTDLVHPSANILIYHNNLLTHLINALKETYPIILQLVGLDSFKAAARDYIERYPSCSGNLDDYGNYFSDFITQYPPASRLVYLPEVAAFEWVCHLLYKAADPTPLNPVCSLMQFKYPLLDIIDLYKGKIGHIDSLETKQLNLLMVRQGDEIVLTPLSLADYQGMIESQKNHVVQ